MNKIVSLCFWGFLVFLNPKDVMSQTETDCPWFKNPTLFGSTGSFGTNSFRGWSARVGQRVSGGASSGNMVYSTCAASNCQNIIGHNNIISSVHNTGSDQGLTCCQLESLWDAGQDHRFMIITSEKAGLDQLTINGSNGMQRIPAGYTSSIRIGDPRSSYDGAASSTSWNSNNANKSSEALFYTLNVNANNALLFINYAVVGRCYDHTPNVAGEFLIRVVKQNNDGTWPNVPISDSLWFRISAPPIPPSGIPDAPWMMGHPGNKCASTTCAYVYKPWTKVAINLNKYLGQNVRVEMYTSDCVPTVDPIYAYICGDFQPMRIDRVGCGNISSESFDTLSAPNGLSQYTWYVTTMGYEDNLYDDNYMNNVSFRQLTQPSNSNIYIPSIEDFILTQGPNAGDTADMQTFMCTMVSALDPNKPITSRIYANIGMRTHETLVSITDSIICDNEITTAWAVGGEGLLKEWRIDDSIAYCSDSTHSYDTVTIAPSVGIHVITLNTTDGYCPTSSSAILNVKGSTHSDSTGVYCNRYVWHGNAYQTSSSSGTKTYVSTNHLGCDSIAYLHLTIYDSTRSDSTGVYCDNYTWHGTIYQGSSVSGTKIFRTTNRWGCDSVAYLHLTIHDSTRSDSTGTYCDSYTWHGTTYQKAVASGTKTYKTTNRWGCDSVAYLHLTIHDSTRSDSVGIYCDSYIWHGVAYQKSGATGTKTYTTANRWGCDSVAYLHLTLFDSSVLHIYDTIVENRLPWRFNGTTYIGSISDTLFNYINSVGCDSLLHYHLFVYPNIYQSYDSTICDSQLPVLWMGRLYANAGSTSVTLHAMHGEDSTVMQTLIVLPTSGSVVRDTIVENQLPWSFNGHVYNDNTYNDPVVIDNVWQCDSTIAYSLYIYRNYNERYDKNICSNYLPYTWMGHTFVRADSIVTSYTAQHGEDSVVVQVLSVRDTSSIEVFDTIVQNMLPWYYDNTRFQSGVTNYEFHRINAAGCDSTVHYNLYVYRNVRSAASRIICDNELPYLWNGVTFYGAGTQSATLRTTHGADSIVLMTLRSKPAYMDSIYVETCNNIPYLYAGESYGISGIFPVSFMAANGCDSVVALHLIVHPTYLHNVTSVICDDSAYVHDGYVYKQPGTYQLVYPTVHGCDSTIAIRLLVRPTYDSHVELVFCQGSSVDYHDTTFTAAGLQLFEMKSMNGCDSVEHLYLFEEEPPIADITVDPEYASYERLDIRIRDNSMRALEREWYVDDEYFGSEPVVYYNFPLDRDSVPVQLIVTGDLGCKDSVVVNIPFRKNIIWTPNVITPKLSDNNAFCVRGDKLETAEVSVFTRQGDLVCTFDGMTECWDGTKNGSYCKQDSYMYVVRYTGKADPKNPKVYTGTVTLLY